MTFLNPLSELPTLGVGINYQKGFSSVIADRSDLVQFLELNPDTLCTWCERFGDWSLQLNPNLYRQFNQIRRDIPVVVHGLSLSIGSASGMNASYLTLMDRMAGSLPFPWHSEHLGFMDVVTGQGEYLHAGTQLPMPFSEEAITLLAPRIQHVIRQYGRPFLLENTSYYLAGIDSAEMDEVDFLNRLCDAVGPQFGLVLDLHNFYCNAENFQFNPYEQLNKLNFERVVEVHVAGGALHKNYRLDVHSDHVPEPVWEMLAWVLPRAPNVKALVYELLEQALNSVTEEGVCANLRRAHRYWERANGHFNSVEGGCNVFT